ncbi:APC family permease [Streptomyces sp. AgN23]|uniref:APC family permease n=1 Tax=Streptomyces sp. AgN23 TaxID=1188315 RepID=UPI001B33C285|nr:APC family permease [Streptomyces sp. AgN23]QTI87248.1 APC family permease [Streptomyces sp. AgN23]
MTVQRQSTTERPPEQTSLRRGSIGAFGMVFMVIAATAPLTAMASNLSLSLGLGVGRGTVALLLVVGALMALFAVGYVVLTRHVTNAGAYFAFIGYGLGKTAGAASAFVAALVYNLATGGMIAATGYFAGLAVESYSGFKAAWYVYGAVALVITFVLGIRGVEIAQRVTTVVSLAQFAVILVLGVVILFERPQGWSMEVLSPQEAIHGNVALTLVFCILSFTGFEAAAIYGEEARAARRSIKVATYSALAILVAIFTFSTWSITAAFADVEATAAGDPGALIFTAADRYLGSWSGSLLSALVACSFLASAVSFHNMSTRYLFALGRSRLLPSSLARVHARHGTPYLGSYVQIVLSVTLLVPFVLTHADPLINLFPAVSGITSLSLLALMAGCCVSVMAAALRGKLTESRWETLVAPGLAGAGLLATMWIVVDNYKAVTGSDALIIALMPLIPIAAALYGAFASSRNQAMTLDADLST